MTSFLCVEEKAQETRRGIGLMGLIGGGLRGTDEATSSRKSGRHHRLTTAATGALLGLLAVMTLAPAEDAAPISPSADGAGLTPLMLAARKSDGPGVLEIIGQKVPLNEVDRHGRTALIWACVVGDWDCAKELIDAGADVTVADAQGETAASHAADLGMVELVDLLTRKGAASPIVHIIPKEPANPPLSAPHAWALGVSALYAQKFGYNPNVLGMQPFIPENPQIMMARDWNIKSREDLLASLNRLTTEGTRAGYQKKGALLAALDDATFNAQLQSDPKNAYRFKAARDGFKKWGTKEGLAWDLCRAAMLVNSGYSVGWISEPEAWDLLMPIARTTQSNFSSWQEMNENFQDGRAVWINQPSTRYDFLTRLMTSPVEPNSPWTKLDWKTDLTTPPNH